MNKYKLTKENTVFLFIDLQKKLNVAMYEKDNYLKNAKVLAELTEILNIKAIQSTQYKKGLGENENFLLDKSIPSFDKTAFSCMGDENLKKAIEELKDKIFVIIGAETHVCVFQTVRDMLMEGYKVQLVEDAVTSRTFENKISGVELMRDMGAVITNTETVLFDLLEKAGTPEFKKAQPLIK